MKLSKNLLPVLALVATGIVMFVFIALVTSHFLGNKKDASSTNCNPTGITHFVNITNGKAQPNEIFANHCDTLTIINHDSQIRLIAFGKHDHHVAYDGIYEKPLDQDQNLTVTLNQTGTFIFHDHLDAGVHGTFTVK